MFVVVDKKMVDFYGVEEFKIYVLSFINIVCKKCYSFCSIS